MRKAIKPNGDHYWEYVLIYVDDALAVSHDPKAIMDHLATKYTLKEGSVGPPTEYLGAQISSFKVPDAYGSEKTCWSMSSDKYVKQAVADVERTLEGKGQHLNTRIRVPIDPKYRPEVDVSPLLSEQEASYYMSLIGVLRWACELGRLDILMPVAMMSRYMAAPREGHMEKVLTIFAYLKTHDHSRMVFDDTIPDFDESRFNGGADWTEYYGCVKEPIPSNAPEARGKAVTMSCFVDASHAGCHVTRRSWSGILIFINRAPILWYSKRQNTCETSTFSSEFIAAKIAVEMVEGLRYKLRMMGVPIDGACNMFCDNESVVKNATNPESVLKKKHCAIAYHKVREAQAAGVCRIAWEETGTNLADLFTKLLDANRLKELTKRILW